MKLSLEAEINHIVRAKQGVNHKVMEGHVGTVVTPMPKATA